MLGNKKIISGKATTVAELVDIIKKFPGDYKISFCGITDYSFMINDKDKTILIDESSYIEELSANEKEN